jgi:hypothetical protein
MDRVIIIAKLINEHLARLTGRRGFVFPDVAFDEFVHTHGAAYFAAMLAVRRGLDPELACIIGLLHDCGRIIGNVLDKSHGEAGAELAPKLLRKTGLFSEAEIRTICEAVRTHPQKKKTGLVYQELIKDADLVERRFSMNDRFADKPHKAARLKQALKELGLNGN